MVFVMVNVRPVVDDVLTHWQKRFYQRSMTPRIAQAEIIADLKF